MENWFGDNTMSSDDDFDLVLSSDFDQPINVAQTEFMDKVNKVVQESIKEKDPSKAIHLCRFLVGVAQLSGLALAKILYELQNNWWKFDIDEDFTDFIFKEIGRHKHTVERYLKIANMLYKYAPKDLRPTLEKMPVGSLIPIASIVHQGYQLEPEDWVEFSEADNSHEVERIAREIRFGVGEKPRKSLISLWMDRNGSVWAYNNNEERFFVGSLDIREAQDNEFVAKAIERIVSNSGILKQ